MFCHRCLSAGSQSCRMVVHVSGHGGRHTTTPCWNGVTIVRLTGGLALGAPVGSLWTLVYILAVSLVSFTLTPQCKLVWGSCKDPSLHGGACCGTTLLGTAHCMGCPARTTYSRQHQTLTRGFFICSCSYRIQTGNRKHTHISPSHNVS